MAPTSSALRLHQNNFDLLRLAFALVVCLVHAYELSGFEALRWTADALSSAVAVKGFFVISGFLIFRSYERSSSLAAYAGKRIRRIYPTYCTVVMLCAVGLVMVSLAPAGSYFSVAWLRYVAANLAFLNFLQPGLPQVFDSNLASAVNGALWTLKIEVMFYLAVPLLVLLFQRYGRLRVMVLVYCSSIAWASAAALIAEQSGSPLAAELGRQLPGQLSYFMAGGFLYYFLPQFERRVGYCLLAAALALALHWFYALPLVEPLALAVVVVACGLYGYLGNFGRYGDFSYGFYILHFPVIQLYLQSGWFAGKAGGAAGPVAFLIAVLLTTLLGAVLLWHLVEKRFLVRASVPSASLSASPLTVPQSLA